MRQEITDRETTRRFLQYVKPYRPQFVLAILAMVLYSAVDAAFIGLIQPLIDNGFGQADSPILKWAPLVVIIAFILRGLFSFGSSYGLNWIGGHVVMTLRQSSTVTRLPAGGWRVTWKQRPPRLSWSRRSVTCSRDT